VPEPLVVTFSSLLMVLVVMLVESSVSRRHERHLRQVGAIEAPGDVYATMRWAYPAAFIAMAVEGAMSGPVAAGTRLRG
jgi:isoprenylcysteine carboxyl methyltransferase (ICMT) family protein YpbQ